MYSTKATPRKSFPAPKSVQKFQIFMKMNKMTSTTANIIIINKIAINSSLASGSIVNNNMINVNITINRN